MFMSVNQVLREIPVSRATLYRALAAGDLESLRIGRRIFVSRGNLDEFIARHTCGRRDDGRAALDSQAVPVVANPDGQESRQ